MKNTIYLLLLTISSELVIGMDSWPKDKPVPFTALPIEYYSDEEPEEAAKPLPRSVTPEPVSHEQEETKKTEALPWWSKGGQPSKEIVAKYQQQTWKWGDNIQPSPEIVAANRLPKPSASYVSPGSKNYQYFCKLSATANYDDSHKSFLVSQQLLKHLCVEVWDHLNPIMDSKGDKAFHDFSVKLKKCEIDPVQNPVAMTKKDLYHRLLSFVLTDGAQCRVNNKDMVLMFKPTAQNGIEGAQISAQDYNFEADKAHHENVMATFDTMLEKISRMDEVWIENPNQ